MGVLHYTFFQNALIGSLFICITCGIVGSYIVARRMVFISGGITHASFGGLGLGFYFGLNPLLSAFMFSVISTFGVEWLSKKQDVREDSAIAAFWSLGMALGVICIFLTPGYTPDISAYLFGNILTVTDSDILFAGTFALIMILVFVCFFHLILYTAFDREFARIKGLKVNLIDNLMMVAITICIVSGIRFIGIMLLMSLLTVPQMTSTLFTSCFRNIIITSTLIGMVSCMTGLFLSYYLNVPSGASVTFVQVAFFLLCKCSVFLAKVTHTVNNELS